ncbi:hypothetical protein ACROYT_G040766 [Oculina patagonica]
MFITIYYGDQKSLLFNPSCSVINLLNSIKERCGYGDTDRVLDLTDETGLVLDLSSHKNEYASKYLASKGYYVLVEKRTVPTATKDPRGSSPSQEVQYVPLLLRPNETFQGYEARVAERRPSQEQSAPSRNTHSRGKRGRLRTRKSIVETN